MSITTGPSINNPFIYTTNPSPTTYYDPMAGVPYTWLKIYKVDGGWLLSASSNDTPEKKFVIAESEGLIEGITKVLITTKMEK